MWQRPLGSPTFWTLDRERTPGVLFHYLLPRVANPADNISVFEWSKHLAISNWDITETAVVFRGRCKSVVVHHGIVEFCKIIADEIAKTKSTLPVDHWPFVLSKEVKADIVEEGYSYAPYSFSLDEDRVYNLLMGKNIYEDRLDGLRELVQNAVDACKLRDAMTSLHEPAVTPNNKGRITIRYEESQHRRRRTETNRQRHRHRHGPLRH